MELVRLTPELTMLSYQAGQSYIWRDDDEVTLIDAGPPGSGSAISAALETLQLSWAAVRRLVLTHFHDDHAGGAGEVRSSCDVEVVAHAADAPIIRGQRQGPPPVLSDWERDLHAQVAAGLEAAEPVEVDLEVEDGDRLPFAGGAQVIATPGHTEGSMGVFLPQHRVLFTGDTAANVGDQLMLGVFNLDRDRTMASFRQLAALPAETACFGHGEPLRHGAAAALQQVAASLPPA